MLTGINSSDDLKMIVDNSNSSLSYNAGNILRKKG